MTRLYISIFILIVFLLSSCGGPRVTSYPSRYPSYPPSKKAPGRKVPGTQRPYVIKGKRYYPLPSAEGFVEQGIASWYGRKFHGRKTSNGERYNMYSRTAAHKTLPMNTHLLVQNLENGRESIVRINDRGPFIRGRVIDLSLTTAKELGIVKKGTARVRITALGETTSIVQNNKKVERFLPHKDFNSGDFFVQIGSFQNKTNAVRLKNKMQSLGKRTVLQLYDRGDSFFYRVQVSAGNTLTAAKSVEKRLSNDGYPGFVIAR